MKVTDRYAYVRARREAARKANRCGECVTGIPAAGRKICEKCCRAKDRYDRPWADERAGRKSQALPANLAWASDVLESA